jgi:alkaline phosphatase D
MFESMASVKSDAFIWLGDLIYTDKSAVLYGFGAVETDSVRQQFKDWKQSHANIQLENSTNLTMGVWDDHDFGINDGGIEHLYKSETQQIFLDYFGVSFDSPRRARNGVYSSEIIGDIGQRVRIILLDARFHRDPIGSDGDLLGAEQWLWLESELQSEIRADMTVIGSGIQVLNVWRPSENWGRFPSARTRLLRLLSSSNTTGVMFISGDVHFAEFTEVKCGAGHRKLVDFTSSGLSHSLDEEVNHFVRPLVSLPSSPFHLTSASLTQPINFRSF